MEAPVARSARRREQDRIPSRLGSVRTGSGLDSEEKQKDKIGEPFMVPKPVSSPDLKTDELLSIFRRLQADDEPALNDLMISMSGPLSAFIYRMVGLRMIRRICSRKCS